MKKNPLEPTFSKFSNAPSMNNLDKKNHLSPSKKNSLFLKIKKVSEESKNYHNNLNDGLFNPAMNELIEKMRSGLIDNSKIS